MKTKILTLALIAIFTLGNSIQNTVFAKSENTTSLQQKKKKKNHKKTKARKKSRVRRFSSSNGCTYQGHQLYVGERGGCYYYSGNSKEYVDRSYCSGCR